MIGAIQAVQQSKSGKTLGVQVNNQWYTTKNWELQQSIGRTISFEPSTSEFNGKTMYWLNDYVFQDESQEPSHPAPQSHAPQPSAPPMSENPAPQPNKDAMIGALALVKATPGPKEQVWENFVYFYNKLDGWDHTIPY